MKRNKTIDMKPKYMKTIINAFLNEQNKKTKLWEGCIYMHLFL